jgi:hypothetical protein
MERESYELMRICRLNRIKIKDPEKWDKAKYDDFVSNPFVQADGPMNPFKKLAQLKNIAQRKKSRAKSIPISILSNKNTMVQNSEP